LQDGDVLQIALVQHFVFLSSDATMPMEYNRMYQEQRKGNYTWKRSPQVWVGEKELVPPLSAPQFRLLQALYDQQGKVVRAARSLTWYGGRRGNWRYRAGFRCAGAPLARPDCELTPSTLTSHCEGARPAAG
jgi:hypothetical protein